MLSDYIFNLLWLHNQFGSGKKKIYWTTLSHNGVMFPDNYEPINVPLIYNNKEIKLNVEAEEVATFYAKYLETEYINIKKFNKNFWKDFRKLLDPNLGIDNFQLCDFSLIHKYLQKERKKNLSLSKEEKEKIKEIQKEKEKNFTIAKVDGKDQPVGNFRIEPPSLFIGRGCHPKIGKIKKRILPEDIIINIGEESKIPDTGIPGSNWKEVINDNTVTWLAAWKDNITGKMKYIRLSDKSDFKAESDKAKFNLARKLKKKLGEIRKINESNLNNLEHKTKQLATALYFIENFSLRVGNEKGRGEADTVGVLSLRIEHITLLEKNKIKLDFLGKDSIRYVNKVEVSEIVYQNIQLFIKNKNNKDQLFDLIVPSDLNEYLQTFMKGLTSKVFRTMNASKLFQRELNKITSKFKDYEEDDKINLILDEFNKANAKVALLCNHQKNVNKNFKKQVNKLNEKIIKYRTKKRKLEIKKKLYREKKKNTKLLRERINKLEENIRKLKSKKKLKIDMKNVSLGTSKVNYIDPRITIAFIKKNKIDIDKLFNNALQEKFYWAFDVDETFVF